MTRQFIQKGGIWVTAQFVLMTAVCVVAPLSPGRISNHTWVWCLSLLLLFWCAFSGISGVQSLRGQRTAFPKPIEGGRLVTNGIYKHIRHPLYSSVISGCLSWASVWQSQPAFILNLLLIILLFFKSKKEEQWLIEKYPAYLDYRKSTRQLIPFIL